MILHEGQQNIQQNNKESKQSHFVIEKNITSLLVRTES
jgi:hypothetical protein